MILSTELNDLERWREIELPGHHHTEKAIHGILRNDSRRNVLNCALTENTARNLSGFELPKGFGLEECLRAAACGILPEGLRDWKYDPKIRVDGLAPWFLALPIQSKELRNLPWFQHASPTRYLAANARHIRYNYDFWQQLKPRTLRGVHTTLILGLPQIGFALTPHIQLEKSFLFLGALARGLCASQLFPARYLFPDGALGQMASAPAPIFADLVPATGGYFWPMVEEEPDPWRVLGRFDRTDRNYGYPFSYARDPQADVVLQNVSPGAMLLPNGSRVQARLSESLAYATLDPELGIELKLDRDRFEFRNGLLRGAVTHDGLPFQLPVQMQCLVYAVVLSTWEMELDEPGNLSSYRLRTRHAAIRGFNFYQRVEPWYSNFLRLVNDVVGHPDFKEYPMSTHLTDSWLGGNLHLANRLTESERALGPVLMRHIYHQQLDWQLGMINLMNHVKFRSRLLNGVLRAKTGREIEAELEGDGMIFHQMQQHFLRFDSHQFDRPSKPASLWPDHNPDWAQLDEHARDVTLPKM